MVLVLLLSVVYVITMKQTQAPKPMIIIHQTWIGDAPLYLAKEKGFFEKRGVDVQILRIEPTQERRALLSSGQADITFLTIDMLVLDVCSGTPEKMVFQTDESLGADAIIAREDIKRVEDLRGKRVGAAIGQTSYFFLKAVMNKHNLTNVDLNIVDLEPDIAGAAFMSGDVDAAATWEPWISKVKENNKGYVLVSSTDVPGVIVDVMAVRPELLKTRRSEVSGVMMAWFDALDYWKEHPDESNQIMADAYGLSKEDFEGLIKELKWNDCDANVDYFYYNKTRGVFNVTQGIIDIVFEEGIISKDPGVDSLIDNTLLERVCGVE